MSAATTNRIANHLLLDLDTPVPVAPNTQPINNTTTNTNSYNTTVNRTVNITLTIGSNNSGKEGSSGSMFTTLIAVGAIVFLVLKAIPFLGAFQSFYNIMGLG